MNELVTFGLIAVVVVAVILSLFAGDLFDMVRGDPEKRKKY